MCPLNFEEMLVTLTFIELGKGVPFLSLSLKTFGSYGGNECGYLNKIRLFRDSQTVLYFKKI